jgi:UDP-N-acetyl-D-mannosaminuronate dehydrogenase
MNQIAVIGCGYVGLSLIKTFQTKFNVIGYDI